MTISKLTGRISYFFHLVIELAGLPVARLEFRSQPCPEDIRETYRYFVKPHPKYKIFKNKSLGAALIDLRCFTSGEGLAEYLRTCGRGRTERRKALARGHQIRSIERNDHVDEMHRINTSSLVRQERVMDLTYVDKQWHYENLPHFRYYGVFDAQENLVGYCNLGVVGNFAIIDRVIGFKNSHGAMYLLITEIACKLITEQQLDYLMYDTIFGALPGLRRFKHRLGFRPYRARYSIQ